MGIVNVSMNFSGSLSKQNERLLQGLCVTSFSIYDSDYETCSAELFTLGQEGKIRQHLLLHYETLLQDISGMLNS